jgi:predicted DNA-binding protein (UPF0251 family)
LDASSPQQLTVATLRELFRNLIAFRSFYEATGRDALTTPDGDFVTLWDIEYLYEQVENLSARQKEAIRLCLVLNYRERDAAVMMGVSETNPVSMYATDGLRKIVKLVNNGDLPRYGNAIEESA